MNLGRTIDYICVICWCVIFFGKNKNKTSTFFKYKLNGMPHVQSIEPMLILKKQINGISLPRLTNFIFFGTVQPNPETAKSMHSTA